MLVEERDTQIGGERLCAWCRQPEGASHMARCPVPNKAVRVRVTLDLVTTVPCHYTKEDAEFLWNDGTWCTSNMLDALNERYNDDGLCLCGSTHVELVEVVDDTPRRAPDARWVVATERGLP